MAPFSLTQSAQHYYTDRLMAPTTRHLARLGDPRWKAKRLSIFMQRGNTCEGCGVRGGIVHVHHGCYIGDRLPWHYPDNSLHVLCATCHGRAQALMTQMLETIGTLRMEQYEAVLEYARALAGGVDPREAVWGRGVLVVSK